MLVPPATTRPTRSTGIAAHRVRGDVSQTAPDFTAFVATSYPAFLRTAFLLTGDRQLAEDLVQTVLATLYLRWDRLDHVTDLHAYARTALVRQSTSWWRRAWTGERPSDAAGRDADLGTDGGDPAERTAERDRLLRHLAVLPTKQRAAVVLRYYLDLSEADAAAAMGCSVGAVKTHTHRGVVRLRELLAAEKAREDADAGREAAR